MKISTHGMAGAAALAITAILSVPAIAADPIMPIYIPPVPIPVVTAKQFDWDRFYAGLYVGYAVASVDVTTDLPPSFFDRSFDLSGGVIGLTLGRNFLLGEDDPDTPEDDRSILFGIEADIGWASGRGVAMPPSVDLRYYMDTGIDAIATLRARIGVPLGEERKVLPYLTAGLVAEHANAALRTSDITPWHRTDGWMWGYTVGGGLEVAMNEDTTIKAEYLYTDIADRLTIDPVAGGVINRADFDFRSNHLFKIGINYHF
jgi:outer membrane immunogenic protein